ncbi:MAG: class I SAM-dependent methyltransferase [Calditrichaeota bacterium]|nr:class I SAM-dependent methyltransferase [Calditrichota bacterium]
MALYRERILPYFLHRGMAGERFDQYRNDVVATARGNVLEIGFGSGLNLAHYPNLVEKVTGIEPNPGMRKWAVRTMHEYEFPVTLLDMDAQRLGFDDGEFDTVVSTWTMCSIPNLHLALSEAMRVLKPGGQLLFIEHGLSPEPKLQKWQNMATPFSQILFDGCHTNRMISEFITQAGFSLDGLKNFFLPGFPKVGGYIYQGIARKSA